MSKANSTPTTLPVASTTGRAGVAGRGDRGEHEHLALGRRGAVDVGAAGDDLLGDAHRRLRAADRRRGGRTSAPPVVDVALAARERGQRRARGRAAPRGRGSGSNATTSVSSRRPSRRDDVGALLPRDHVRVGDDEVRARRRSRCPPGCGRTPGPSPARSSCVTRCATSAGMPSAGGDPASGDVSVSNTSGNGLVADQAAERLRLATAGRARRRSMARATARVAHRARRPAR